MTEMNQINLEISANRPLVDEQQQVHLRQHECSSNTKEYAVQTSHYYRLQIDTQRALSIIEANTSSTPLLQSPLDTTVEEQTQQEISSYILSTWIKLEEDKLRQSMCITPKYIKLAEQYIRNNIRQSPLKIEEIAAYANVSIRTLSSGFRKYRNISPSLFIRDLRLEMVREELLNAGGGKSIAEIAYASGYLNLGTFIRLYKQKFRELPSTTLRCYFKE
ncbi:AraC family transcriptional regulator [Acinetobacter baylyi]|uniref:Putative transcriptional regulator (AraC family) n=2 Tax=Moraxellaceae TaxID=468 RepID=Q6FBB1_ACIAD|nr:AraC family transcriptional regulator [Acinetobacter baylyi]MAK31796.1 AraC family transcriptional regulator [Acinetobacter sp.]CAG68652.1 putative transcriptional regulator (AraC family) [Acinetobacter baylyi ADP1]KAF2374924.1 AraC family transcriptional regulator [Acinetobacter baylyi]KAF2375675.1 AraC family transcriptional regulator [Acinetobacter baylyi]